MNKKTWKRAYHLARLMFRDEHKCYTEVNAEGLIKEFRLAGDIWAKGNTNWYDYDCISRYKEAYRATLHDYELYRGHHVAFDENCFGRFLSRKKFLSGFLQLSAKYPQLQD